MKTLKKPLIYLFFLFFFFSLTRNIADYGKKLDFFEEFKKEYENEQKKNDELKKEILKSRDYTQVEKTIRDKLNLAKKDEVVVLIPHPSATPIPKVNKASSTYLLWLKLFLGN